MLHEQVFCGVFDRFVAKTPVALMAMALIERVFEPAKLDRWFRKAKDRQYTRELTFSALFQLMSQVAFKVFPSLHAAYQAEEDIGASVVAVYAKVKHIEPQTSRAIVRETAVELSDAIVQLKGERRPLLPGYRSKILDGNCIAASEHRIKELRNTSAGALPGKSLVVYDHSLGVATDLLPCEDGHAQERSLLNEVLEMVQERDLWIADRNFCVREFLEGIEDRHARFIVRHHAQVPFTPLGPEKRIGAIATGIVFEQPVEISGFIKGSKPRRYRLIRVRLKKLTRDGDRDIFLLTDLSKSAAPAKVVADLYQKRWSIERMFQELEAHLNSEVTTLGYPKAALFAFCIAVAAYNALSVIKAALRRVHGEDAIETMVSGYYIAGELARTHEGMMVALPPEFWDRFRSMTSEAFIAALIIIAQAANLARYQKHPRGPKKPRTERTAHAGKPHVSTAQLLWGRTGREHSAP
jgi:hypothetical protein